MITSWGGLFPVFKSIDLPSDKEIQELIIWLKKNLRRIYSIMGTEERVQILHRQIDWNQGTQVNYNLMIKGHDHIRAPKPYIQELGIQKATPEDAAVLLSLELEYQKEEVFLDSSLINNSQIYHNLRTSLLEQEVYYVTSGIVPIAKAGTNAIGQKWNQIGGVYTEKDFRSKGLSSWLMDYILNILESDGKKTVLFVKEENIAAEKVYTKLGFEKKKNFNIIYYV